MKISLSSPSIVNSSNEFKKNINKLLLHNLNESEPKLKVLSKIQKIIKTEKSLYNKNFNFSYSQEYHLARNQLNSFDKTQKAKKDIINYLKNENKKFKKIFETNSKEFKALSFNSLNKQKNLKKTLSLLINNNYENNIFIESPLLMSNNKDINIYYSNYDEHNDNVYKDKKTNIPIIDEDNDESIKFSHKLLNNLNGRISLRKKNILSNIDINPVLSLNSNFKNNDEYLWKYSLNHKRKYQNLMKDIIKENLEIKQYNNSIKKLLDDIKRGKRHSTRVIDKNNRFMKLRGLRNTNLFMKNDFNLNLGSKENKKRKFSIGYASSEKNYSTRYIFEKLFKDILKRKNNSKEVNASHLESIYNDIIKSKDKFLTYKFDKKLNLHHLPYNLKYKNKNKLLIEKELNENKKVENLDFDLLWRFHNYKNFK